MRKQIAGVGYDPVVVTCGVPEGAWGQWLTAFLEGKAPVHAGAIIFLSHSYQQVRRLEWQHASIASLTFPGLDGGGKDAAHLTVTIRPELTVAAPASGALKDTPTKTKAWRSPTSRSRFPASTHPVSSVAALTVSQSRAVDAVGEHVPPTKGSGPLEVGDLVLTVAEVGPQASPAGATTSSFVGTTATRRRRRPRSPTRPPA